MKINISHREKKKICFGTVVSNTFTVIRTVKIKPNTTSVRLGDSSFHFDMSCPTLKNKNTLYYYIDTKKGQVSFKNQSIPLVSPELLDLIIVRKIGTQLLKVVEKTPMMGSLLIVLMGIGLGISLGFILGNFFPMVG